MLAANKKLHLDNDFNKVFKTGRSYYGRFLGVKICKSNNKNSRFGLILGLKIDKSAVKRHQLKRKIFNIIVELNNELPFFGDYVIIALPSIKEATSSDIKNELKQLLGVKDDKK